jgi:hypothetical protein
MIDEGKRMICKGSKYHKENMDVDSLLLQNFKTSSSILLWAWRDQTHKPSWVAMSTSCSRVTIHMGKLTEGGRDQTRRGTC